MKVLHISPTYFSDRSVIGGGERYAYELASAMAKREKTVFLSFARKPYLQIENGLVVEYLNRNFLRFVKWVDWADVVHCHQVFALSTDFAVALGKFLGKKVFVTDLGGGQRFAFSYHLPILKSVDKFLLISQYSREIWERVPLKSRARHLEVVYGGVDTSKFSPADIPKSNSILFVGRLLPHKGIDYLIEALSDTMTLDVVGRVYDKNYLNLLKLKGKDKKVRFHHQVSDEELLQMYRQALITVQPSVYRNCYGSHTAVAELLGLSVLESMACGTPVIVTDVASFPEIVEDGVTGFIVPPNDPKAIKEKMERLIANPSLSVEMGKQAREKVVNQFGWDMVVDRCLKAYHEN